MRSYIDNLGLKAFTLGTRDEEVFNEGATIGGDRTVGESFGVCCPGIENCSQNRQMCFHSH